MKKNKTIAVLGGTFDPIHNGHIQIASTLLKKIPLSEIRFLPCYQPVHRPSTIASSSDRLNMIRLALENHTNLILDDREIKRRGPSFMIDTLISLRKDFSKDSLCLIMGEDAFVHLPSWHRFDELLDYAHFIVINRPHLPTKHNPALNSFLHYETNDFDELQHNLNGKIYRLTIPPIPISATLIRKQLNENKNPNKEIPEKVFKYIKENKIYFL